jgi:hypothetical protein
LIYRYTEVAESDISFNSNYNWNQGPGYPASDQWDLPSVAFHEFGHWADPNAPHDARCSGSPLTESLGAGEWWRGYGDWYEIECGNSPSSPGAFKRAKRPIARFRTVIHRLPDRVIGAAQRTRPHGALNRSRMRVHRGRSLVCRSPTDTGGRYPRQRCRR